MPIVEKTGLMKYKDAAGNLTIMYPITTLDNVDGAEEALAGRAPLSHVSDTNAHITGEYTESEIQTMWDSVKVVTLVTFTITDTLGVGGPTGSFTAERGMTLTEWLASSYKTSHVPASFEHDTYGTVTLSGVDENYIKEGSSFDWTI